MGKRQPPKARKPRPPKKPKPKKAGRPSKFRPEFIEQAQKLAHLGATDPEVAAFFNVSPATLSNWKVTIPGFLEALKLGKEGPDNQVEASLLHRARGYSHPAVKIIIVEGKVVKVPYTEHYPPDSTACIFWLKNRRREIWRDVNRAEITTPPGHPMEHTYVPAGTELLADHYARLAAAAQEAASGADTAAARAVGPGGRHGQEPEDDQGPVPDGSVLPPR